VSAENVETVRRAYASPAPLSDGSYVAPDAEFDFTALYPDQPVLRGVESMRAFRDTGPWGGSIHFQPERFFDVDEQRVLVFLSASATGQGSGAPIVTRIAHEFVLRDGLIVRVTVHPDQQGALAAVGIAE
jgi:hypothetical protein